MARHKGNFEHGTVKRYRQADCTDVGVPLGQRCADCKQAMSMDRKQSRAGVPVEKRGSNVVSIEGRSRTNTAPAQSNSKPNASNPERAMGSNERAVHDQFDQYRAEHAVRVELLLAGARIMDDPDKQGIHATTMRQMEMIIDKITAKKKSKSGGRLAVVSAMAGRRSS